MFPGVGLFLFMMLLNYFYVKRNLHFQSEYLNFKGKRVRLMEEVIGNIKFIKANVLEFFFLNKIEAIRKLELKWIKKIAYRIVYVIFNSWISPSLMTFATFFFFVYFGNQFTVAILFTSLLVMRTYESDLAFLPNVVGTMIDFMVSSQRIVEFMVSENIKTLKNDSSEAHDFDLVIENYSFYRLKKKKKTNGENPKVQKTDSKETELFCPTVRFCL